jgi:hypothetical protein
MDQIKDIFNYLEMNRSSLTSSQYEFVKSLKKYYKAKKNLTPRQIDSLQNIKKYMKVEVASE